VDARTVLVALSLAVLSSCNQTETDHLVNPQPTVVAPPVAPRLWIDWYGDNLCDGRFVIRLKLPRAWPSPYTPPRASLWAYKECLLHADAVRPAVVGLPMMRYAADKDYIYWKTRPQSSEDLGRRLYHEAACEIYVPQHGRWMLRSTCDPTVWIECPQDGEHDERAAN
jgi:hypothetical protein